MIQSHFHLRILLAAILLGAAGVSWGQGAVSSAEVVDLSWNVQWMEPGSEAAPVGRWAPADGFWEGEIPWGVWEAGIEKSWPGAVALIENWEYEALPAGELTVEQRRQLATERSEPRVRVLPSPKSVQVIAPMFRMVGSGQFERLLGAELIFGEGVASDEAGEGDRDWVWADQSVLAEGTFVRLAIAKDGVYRIDASLLAEAGIAVDTINPKRVQLYGNGGRMLPMENAVERPTGLRLAALEAFGEEDGVWGSSDYFLFYGCGPNHTYYDSDNERWTHERHAYSDSAYYFLRVDGLEDVSGSRLTTEALEGNTSWANDFVDCQYHEEELYSPNRSGREWFGEAFRLSPTRTYFFPMPHALVNEENPGEIDVRVYTQSYGSTSTFDVETGGSELSLTPTQTGSSSTSNVANTSTGTAGFTEVFGSDDAAQVQAHFTFNPGSDGAEGWVDYIRVTARRSLIMFGAQMGFNGRVPDGGESVMGYELSEANYVHAVWDVTDPVQPVRRELGPLDSEGMRSFVAPLDTVRRFIAVSDYGFPSPDVRGIVANQNLHSWRDRDLVIITQPMFMDAAARLAEIHAAEGLTVGVATQAQVFNEFSSGSPDPTALKMFLLMLRHHAGGDPGQEPRYLQLLGDGTFANRGQMFGTPYVITYQSRNSISPTGSYVSDDYFAFLDSEYGEGIGDKMAVGVGRIPCSNPEQADEFVAKVEAYIGADSTAAELCDHGWGSARLGPWRNTVSFVSDDMDGNGGPTETVHMTNSDEHSETISDLYNEYDVTKIYLDAYPQLSTPGGERYPDAAEAIDRQVREGALIVNYIGHGGERGWTHERVLNTTTIREWDNLQRMPLFMTATCELARFDDPEVESAGEMLVMNPDGGAVGMLTTTRVVFSGSNQELNRAFFDIVLEDTPEAPLLLGDIARITKNDNQVSNSSNKRNFTLLGDVALRLAYPRYEIYLSGLPDTLRALEVVEVRGFVGTASGDTLHDFNGLAYPKVFDKRTQVTTLNNDGGNSPYTYTQFQNVLHRGVSSVEEGVFTFEMAVPKDIDYAYGDGRISCYAVDEAGARDAHGYTEDFTIGGVDEEYVPDDVPPTVKLFMNDSQFRSGGMTNEEPELYAIVEDAGGINAAGSGIGHDIKAVLDSVTEGALVLNNYYIADLNTYTSGVVRYPFEDLEPGRHTLDLVVWDVQNNKGKGHTEFVVADGLETALAEVLAYPNPTTDFVDFRFEHNQACAGGTVRVEIFSATGTRVHVAEAVFDAHGFRSAPLGWDTRTTGGAAVDAGVYVFRLTVHTLEGGRAQYADQIVVLRR